MERRKILIATKTYPSISTKYRETVCTAGVLLDNDEKPIQWIRIYPIKFRQLDFDQRYPRWSIISAEVEKNDRDIRPESYRINDSSIRVIRKIDTKKGWLERKELVLHLQFSTVQQIKAQGKSLGIIKPQTINRYYYETTDRDWKPQQQAVLDQLDLFEPSVQLEKIPYNFGYEFIEQDGTKHRYSISDWEIKELYRNCRNRSKENTLDAREKEAVEKVRQKLEDDFMYKKDLHFIVGNLKSMPHIFTIIGLFYPPLTIK